MYPLLLAIGLLVLRVPDAVNLVHNGDFARVAGGVPREWQAAGSPDRVTQRLEAVAEGGRTCARLVCSRFSGGTSDAHAMLAQVGGVRLEAGHAYEFSCRAREEGMAGHSVSVAISDTRVWANCGLDLSLSLQPVWREYRRRFTATRSVGESSRLQFWYGEAGTLYLADVRIVEVSGKEPVRFANAVQPAGGKNLVPNGDFGVGAAGWLSLGQEVGWGNLAHLHGRVMSETAPARRSFLRIPMGPGVAPALAFDYLRPAWRPQTRVLAASLGWIPVRAGQPYTLSCAMRASRTGARGRLGVVQADPARPHGTRGPDGPGVALGMEWRSFRYTFRPVDPYLYVVVGPDLETDERVDVDVTDVQLEAGEQATAFEARSPVEVAVEPSAPGGVFAVGEPAALVVRARNHGGAARGARVRFTVTDFFDRPAVLAPVTLRLPPGGAVTRRVALPAGWRGFYRVRAECGAAGRPETHTLRLAVVPRREGSDSVLGINHAFPDPWLVPQAARAGITWYRDWSLKWQDVEPRPGAWTWAATDPQIDRVVKAGAHVVALMPPFPAAQWSSEAPGSPAADPNDRDREAWAPRDPAGLSEFVARAVARYRDRVRVWEFLNEPLYTDYALPGGSGANGGKGYGVEDYLRLLRTSREAIRRSDPTGRIIGGLAGGPEQRTAELIAGGLLPLIDLLNLHIYPGSRAPEGYLAGMETLNREMAAHGGRKPIWITEFSYYADDDPARTPYIPGDDWFESGMLPTERDGAEYTVRFLTLMLACGAEKVFLHSGASGAVNAPNNECCLFAGGGAPRKVLPAVAVLAGLLGPRPRCTARESRPDGLHAAAFETGARAVVVTWRSEAPRAARLPAAARRLDIMGRPLPAGPITLGSAPVYLVGTPGRAATLARGVWRGAEAPHRGAVLDPRSP